MCKYSCSVLHVLLIEHKNSELDGMEQFGLGWGGSVFFFIKARSVYEKLRYYKRYGKHHKDIIINILNQRWRSL